jgi:hypothetical protein
VNPDIRPPVQFERTAFGFAAVMALAPAAFVAFEVGRGLDSIFAIVVSLTPLFALSFMSVGVGVVLRRKRLENSQKHAAFVSRMLEAH